MDIESAATLELVLEAKISDLIRVKKSKRYEASGVYFKDNYFHIVFDSLPHVMVLKADWYRDWEDPVLHVLNGEGIGYEDITFKWDTRRWYCLIEAAEDPPGKYKPRLDEFDESFAFIASYSLDFSFDDDNKGFEGLSTFHYRDRDYLLGLCEGNDCKRGKARKDRGEGRIQVFELIDQSWEHFGTIKLPEAVSFDDYSSMDFRRPYLTVLSQESSAMWVGRVRPNLTDLDDVFEDDGQLYRFPLDDKDRIVYRNLEGVTWINERQLAVVSDKMKSDQPEHSAKKDQSIHIFSLPDGDPGKNSTIQ